MLAIRGLATRLSFLTKLKFNFNQPPRDPSLPTQNQYMLPYSINFLHDNKGAIRYPKQIGRGPGSGKGKTAGRGHKGQLARTGGKIHPRFQGGQTPITRRLPKYGRVFKTRPEENIQSINIGQIDYYIKKGVIDSNKIVNIRTLVDCGIVKAKKATFGVKLLSRGIQKIDYPLNIQVTDASKCVIQKLKNIGGNIKLVHRTPLKLRQHIFPQKYPLPLAQPITPWWKVQKLLRKSQDRGIPIQFKAPKWMETNPIVKKQQTFAYPKPRDPNPEKIRKRKAKLFKKFNYGI